MALQEGDAAPEIAVPRDGNGNLSLGALKGRKIVLYAYPKDDTPTCTKEAIAFNALHKDFAAAGAEVIGLSPDPVKRHDTFKAKYGLDFPLLADEGRSLIEAFDLWVEKSLYGRRYMGVERTTILIDRNGIIVRIWRKVRIAGHAEEVLAAVKSLPD